MKDKGLADAKRRYICLKKIESPIVTTRTAIFPKLFFLNGRNKNNSKDPPKIPHKTILIIVDIKKFIPKGEYQSKNKRLESGDDEKNKVIIAPNAIISPCAKFTIRVTP